MTSQREQFFPDYWKHGQKYWSLEEGKPRANYVKKNPEYKAYLNWRTDWLLRNPDAAPYLTDKPPKYKNVEQLEANLPFRLTPEEWRQYLGRETFNLILDYGLGDELPPIVERRLEQLGVDAETVLSQLR
jgi:hypothetical protein